MPCNACHCGRSGQALLMDSWHAYHSSTLMFQHAPIPAGRCTVVQQWLRTILYVEISRFRVQFTPSQDLISQRQLEDIPSQRLSMWYHTWMGMPCHAAV